MNATPRHHQGVYERAEVVVDDAVRDELAAELGARLCRVVGKEKAQIAICRAIIQVTGNLLAKLAGAGDAEQFHRERAAHYCAAVAREPGKWRVKR